MNRTFAVIIGAILTLAAVFAFAHRGATQNEISSAATNNAAFRDGRYQAQLDDQFGRKSHLRAGRWSSAEDRASFLAGYQQASARLASAPNDETGTFRRGFQDGTDARQSQRPFNAQSDFSRSVQPLPAASEEKLEFARLYADGYQLGYYGSAPTPDSQTDLQPSDGD